jgi:hypothetical protein
MHRCLTYLITSVLKFDVLEAVNIKIVVLWDIMPYNPIDSYQPCRGTGYPQLQGNPFSLKSSRGSLFFVFVTIVFLKHF